MLCYVGESGRMRACDSTQLRTSSVTYQQSYLCGLQEPRFVHDTQFSHNSHAPRVCTRANPRTHTPHQHLPVRTGYVQPVRTHTLTRTHTRPARTTCGGSSISNGADDTRRPPPLATRHPSQWGPAPSRLAAGDRTLHPGGYHGPTSCSMGGPARPKPEDSNLSRQKRCPSDLAAPSVRVSLPQQALPSSTDRISQRPERGAARGLSPGGRYSVGPLSTSSRRHAAHPRSLSRRRRC